MRRHQPPPARRHPEPLTATAMPDRAAARIAGLGTTIFTEMSALAMRTGPGLLELQQFRRA